jgi:hypothetical protein
MKSHHVLFQGTVVRAEPDGFVVIHFDHPIGSNTHGIISSSTGTSTSTDTAFTLTTLSPHVRVSGTAIPSNQNKLPKIIELHVGNQRVIP